MTNENIPQKVTPGGTMLRGGTVRLIMRNYFSSHLLAAAGTMVRSAGEIEERHDVTGPSRFDLEQRGHVLGAILCGVGFFEAMINELFQDAFDGNSPEGGAIAPLPESTRDLMAEYWRATDLGKKGRALDKTRRSSALPGSRCSIPVPSRTRTPTSPSSSETSSPTTVLKTCRRTNLR